MEPFLNARQVAELLGFSASTILDWFERGDLPGYKLPGGIRFRPSDIEVWAEQHLRNQPARPPLRAL